MSDQRELSFPDVGERLPVPVAPGSATSEAASHTVRAQRELRRVIVWFAAQSEPRTRHECAAALYPYDGGIGSACGRINTLLFTGDLEEVGRQGKRATIAITAQGLAKSARLVEAA